ncbi:MAG: hypothetical protein P8X68_12960, partial [Desulfobacterales bacterium]
FYSGITINKVQTAILEQIEADAVVVYATKYNSHFEFLFYYSRYQKLNLPFPQIGFDYEIYSWQPLSRIIKMMLAHVDYFIHHRSFPHPYKSGYIAQSLL